MRLKRVSIRGFRSVAAMDQMEVGKPTLLTGHNDAGKTAILDATRFLLGDYLVTERDQTYLDDAGAPGAGDRRVDETAVEGLFALSPAEQVDLVLPADVRLRRRFTSQTGAIHEIEVETPVDERLRGLESKLLAELKELVKTFSIQTSARRKDEYLAACREHASQAPQTRTWVQASPQVVNAMPAVERFNPAGVHDADDAIRQALDTAFKGHIASEDHRGSVRELEDAVSASLVQDASAIQRHIMDRCADIGDVQIVPVVSFSEGLRSTQVSVSAREGNGRVGLGESGAGRARRVALAVWEFTTGLLAGVGDIVMIYDEPDTHLDYAHQREFMQIVRSQCALENVSMLIATHSMNLIDGIDIADVVHVIHDEGSRSRIDVLSDGTPVGRHLGAIAAALGLRNTVLLHERLFVGVEGPTETACFPVLFLLATGRQLESAGIALWGCRNNEGALDFAEFLVAHNRNVVFVVDEDSRRNAKHVFSDEKLRRRGLDPHRHAIYVGQPMELEELFTDEQWCEVANKEWARTDERDWEVSDFSQHRSSKFSTEVLEMTKTASDTGPTSKPDAMVTLSLSLSDRDEVPEALRLIFDELIKRAG